MDNEIKLKNILAVTFGANVSDIDDESSPDNLEKWDSLKHLNLIISLEEEFSVSFSEEEVVEMMSLALIREVLIEHGITF